MRKMACIRLSLGTCLLEKKYFYTNRHHKGGNWKQLWKTNAPYKAFNLSWRTCRGYVPTRPRLPTRYVPCSNIFPLCGNAGKDGLTCLCEI